jgi:hypothetical protein
MSGTSAQEKALIAQAAARMRQIEQQDKRLYDMMLSEALAINPEDSATQAYNTANIRGIAATEAAVEAINPRNRGEISEVTRAGLINASRAATEASGAAANYAADARRSALGNLGTMPRSNAALGVLALEQTRRADQATRAAGIRSALGTVITEDPGTATEDELLGGADNDAALVGAGVGGG